MVSQLLSIYGGRAAWRRAASTLRPWSVVPCSRTVYDSEAARRSISSSRSPFDSPCKVVKVPVLIVGGGPVGLTLSSLLSHMGVPSILVEKSERFTTHPQAHFINNRTMEIFRHLDGLASEIESLQPPLVQWRKFAYCLTMTGEPLGTVDHFASDQSDKDNQKRSPTSLAHFSQNRLLPLLRRRAESRFGKLLSSTSATKQQSDDGIPSPILMGHECTSIRVQNDAVMATIEQLQSEVQKKTRSPPTWPISLSYKLSRGQALYVSGSLCRGATERGGRDRPTPLRPFAEERGGSLGSRFIVACDWLIAADGARSWSRKTMGVKMEGEAGLQNLMNVHFVSTDLGEMLSQKNPAMLYFVFNPDVIMVVVAHDLDKGEFVAQIPYYPPQQQPDEFSPQVCKSLILKAAGLQPDSGIDVDVRSIRRWTMNAQVAEKYICGDERVFLVGDAAHQFSPAGAFGMNTGVQDAHNLAWKLAAVYQGFASKDLLKTYETERRPIAIANSKLSIHNFNASISVPAALGLDPNVLRIVHTSLNRPPASLLPRPVQKTILEQAMAAGRLQVSEWIMDPRNPLGRMRLAHMRRILERGDSLQLQFPQEDLGFCYAEGALVPEEHNANGSERGDPVNPASTDPALHRTGVFVPNAKPGARLPHWEVKILRGGKDATATMRKVSSLDLVPSDGSLLLIVSHNGDTGLWEDVARRAADSFKVPLKMAIVWPCAKDDKLAEGSPIDQRECIESPAGCWWDMEGRDTDKVEVLDIQGVWKDICWKGETGADPVLLVRPDGHVAWRSHSNCTEDCVPLVEMVLGHVLCYQIAGQVITRAAHAAA